MSEQSEKIIASLDRGELAAYKLRTLYAEGGYSRYKMSKFEEYDLYMRNKDFLVSDGIITFTDEDGRLLALKPDVTLSIIKNSRIQDGEVLKLCYDENVYRQSAGTRSFHEIKQVGIECIGEVTDSDVCDVLCLAEGSLKELSSGYALEISSLDIVSALIAEAGISREGAKKLLFELGSKAAGGIAETLRAEGADEITVKLFTSLATLYGAPKQVLPRLDEFKISPAAEAAIDRLTAIVTELEKRGAAERLVLDFSAVGNMKYYNGITVKGYIDGIPTSVLSGGQYDNLMGRMKKNSRAIGFAVYLDELEKLPE